MKFAAPFRRSSLVGALLPLTFAASGPPGSVPAADPPAAKVVAQPGTMAPKKSGPIEPKSFAISLGDVRPGATIPIEMELTNTSDAPLKFLGGHEWCSRSGCFTLDRQPSRTIPPRGTYRVKAHFKASQPDPQRAEQVAELQDEFYLGGERTFAVPYRVVVTVRSNP